MPWFIEERDGQHCVVKGDRDNPGDVEKCHDTREQALAHQRALYANEPEARSLAWLDEQREVRSASFQPIDVADDGSSFEGYAAVFDEEAGFDMPGVGHVAEIVKRGAFKRALTSGENVPMMYHHLETHPILASTQAGTLQLEEDNRGLRVKADIAKHYIGDAVRELVKRGDIPGMSWGFIAGKGNSRVERRGNGILRTLTGFKKILDVSPTWDPTYRGTEAELRSRAFGLALTPDLAELIGTDLSVSSRPDVAADSNDGGEESRDGSQATEEQRSRSVEQRKRALQLLILETGGYDDAS